jgi:nicotinate-nucleotide adenylyltransferase
LENPTHDPEKGSVTEKLGVLGGTFDPVHLGHLIIAQEAQARLGLDRVLFVPTGQPWMKRGRTISPGEHRVAMARLAVADSPRFEVSSMEVDRPGPTYTVETLQALRREGPNELEIFFIIGADSLEGLARWKELQRVRELCTLVAVSRPGHREPDVASTEAGLPDAAPQVIPLPGIQIGIGGSEIRERVAAGRPIRYWVPPAVEEYIMRNGLYAAAEALSQPRGGAR